MRKRMKYSRLAGFLLAFFVLLGLLPKVSAWGETSGTVRQIAAQYRTTSDATAPLLTVEEDESVPSLTQEEIDAYKNAVSEIDPEEARANQEADNEAVLAAAREDGVIDEQEALEIAMRFYSEPVESDENDLVRTVEENNIAMFEVGSGDGFTIYSSISPELTSMIQESGGLIDEESYARMKSTRASAVAAAHWEKTYPYRANRPGAGAYTSYTPIFHVTWDNGTVQEGYCLDPEKDTPMSTPVSYVHSGNWSSDQLATVLFWGYSGAGFNSGRELANAFNGGRNDWSYMDTWQAIRWARGYSDYGVDAGVNWLISLASGSEYDRRIYEGSVPYVSPTNSSYQRLTCGPPSGYRDTFIRIEKKNEDGQPLQGVHFLITELDGTHLVQLWTNENGIAEYRRRPGTYKIYEIGFPEGYQGYGGPWQLVSEKAFGHGVTSTIQVTNYKNRGVLEVLKTDETDGGLLEGAVFDVLDASKNQIASITTGADGAARLENLLPGTYYVQETQAPAGFVLDETLYEVEVKADTHNQITSVLIANSPMTTLFRIRKVDPDGSPLAGASFALIKCSTPEEVEDHEHDEIAEEGSCFDDVVHTVTSSASGLTRNYGELVFDELTAGEYRLLEYEAPEGYKLETAQAAVSITLNEEGTLETFIREAGNGTLIGSKGRSEVYDVVNRPLYTEVSLNKRDRDSNRLEGAVFALYGCSQKDVEGHVHDETEHSMGCFDEKIDEALSDSSGKLVFDAVEEGEYRIVETQAPTGYAVSKGKIGLTVSYENGDWTSNFEKIGEIVLMESADGKVVINDRDPSLPAAGLTDNTLQYGLIAAGISAVLLAGLIFLEKKIRKTA